MKLTNNNMNNYEVAIHYVIPSHCGGIASRVQLRQVSAPNEDKAEQSAINLGVNDPNYLYTQMIEVNRVYN